MTKLLSIAALLLLAGCDDRGRYVPPMSNDAIIAETKKCEDAGLRAVQMIAMWDGITRGIQCMPRESK